MSKDFNLIPVVIISAALIISTLIFKSTGIYIKSVSGADVNGRVSDTISVSGDGKVNAKPDMVQINIGFQELAPTSRAALDKVNQKLTLAMKVLKDNGIPDSDITTDNLYVYTEYDYSTSFRKINGQRASQTLSVKIKKIDDKATKPAKIIDELSNIDNVQMNGITFDIEDKTKFFTQARELAFNKAKQKASELANLAGVKLIKPISISDTTYDYSPVRYSNVAELKSAIPVTGGGSDTSISTGQMDISANLQILWGIE